MRKSFLTYFLSSLLLVSTTGCGNATTPIPPPIEEPGPAKPIARTDLPTNWVEVKGDGWSYGLPIHFSPLPTKEKILAIHYSPNVNLLFGLMSAQTESTDLKEYVHTEFVLPSVQEGKIVLASREQKVDGRQVIAIHMLHPEKKPGGMRPASLDFFTQKGKTVYYLGCYSEANNLVDKSSVCFEIVNTLRL